MEFWIPYGNTEVPVRVPDDNFYRVLEPPRPNRGNDPIALLREALDNPIGEHSLLEHSQPGSKVGILIDSLVPQGLRQPAIELLRSRFGPPGTDSVKVFLRERLGGSYGSQEARYVPLSPSRGHFTEIGRTSSGTPVSLHEEFAACDTKVCVGIIYPHFASGFTGGHDVILPGASSLESVTKNRSLIVRGASSPLDYGKNPVLSDSLEASRLSGMCYGLCLVPDGAESLDSAFAGELEPAFKEATSRYLQVHTAKVDRRSDVVIFCAGKTLGSDLYHGVRVLSNAWAGMKKEGTIILVAECSKGVGDSSFQEYSRRFPERRELLSELRYHFKLGAHVSLFLQEASEKHRIQLVSVLPDIYVKDSFHLKASRTASSAVQQSIRAEGKDAKILVVTRGDLTIPVMSESS